MIFPIRIHNRFVQIGNFSRLTFCSKSFKKLVATSFSACCESRPREKTNKHHVHVGIKWNIFPVAMVTLCYVCEFMLPNLTRSIVYIYIYYMQHQLPQTKENQVINHYQPINVGGHGTYGWCALTCSSRWITFSQCHMTWMKHFGTSFWRKTQRLWTSQYTLYPWTMWGSR